MTRRLETAAADARRGNGRARPARHVGAEPEGTVGWPRSRAETADDRLPVEAPGALRTTLVHIACCAGIPLLLVLVLSAGALGGLVFAGLGAAAGLGFLAVRARRGRSGALGGGAAGCCARQPEPPELTGDRR
jgi:hypothetical protein